MSEIIIKMAGITQLNTDCIVNAANSRLLCGGGVCGIIFQAAGIKQLSDACDAIGHCDTGSAVITPAFHLNAKYIIHAVGPIWSGGHQKESQLLYSAYYSALQLAKQHNCHSIGFPLISAGIYGYPIDQAWRKALQACHDFIQNNNDYDITIEFAIIDPDIYDLGLQTKNDLGI